MFKRTFSGQLASELKANPNDAIFMTTKPGTKKEDIDAFLRSIDKELGGQLYCERMGRSQYGTEDWLLHYVSPIAS